MYAYGYGMVKKQTILNRILYSLTALLRLCLRSRYDRNETCYIVISLYNTSCEILSSGKMGTS